MIVMICRCEQEDLEEILSCINDAARAYRGIIPEECWSEPYMLRKELEHEIVSGVVFWGWEENSNLLGVMGLQEKEEVALIRHAYVHSEYQRKGLGSRLFKYLRSQTDKPLLVGTWQEAGWAIDFYKGHGLRVLSSQVKDQLLREYWSLPNEQIKNSIVLADHRWNKSSGG